MKGSSPLTRGKRREALPQRLNHGLIPAHAGKTSALTGATESWGAHPRSRGENPKTPRENTPRNGSSPLTRGKRLLLVCVRLHIGLIPAHAGKTSSASSARVDSRAHPRSRGENYRDGNHLQLPEGSSPLTRGKPPRSDQDQSPRRLIPAHAGKTRVDNVFAYVQGAHPRSRGENSLVVMYRTSLSGSSPLTRGKLLAWACASVRRGLIPAHAGKTDNLARTQLRGRAHPRSRGEN